MDGEQRRWNHKKTPSIGMDKAPDRKAYTDSNGNFHIIIGDLCGFVAAPHLTIYEADCTNLEDVKARTWCDGTNKATLFIAALERIADSKTPTTIDLGPCDVLGACQAGADYDYDVLRNSYNPMNETHVAKVKAHVDTIQRPRFG